MGSKNTREGNTDSTLPARHLFTLCNSHAPILGLPLLFLERNGPFLHESLHYPNSLGIDSRSLCDLADSERFTIEHLVVVLYPLHFKPPFR